MTDEEFIKKYEELLDKGYCDCNEMNCIDNDVPRKILNIVKGTKLGAKQLLEENKYLKDKLRAVKEVAVEHLKKEIELKAHQKEFIEWLEANLEALEMCDRELILTNNKKEIKAYKEVLSKYKELIGDNNVKDIA